MLPSLQSHIDPKQKRIKKKISARILKTELRPIWRHCACVSNIRAVEGSVRLAPLRPKFVIKIVKYIWILFIYITY